MCIHLHARAHGQWKQQLRTHTSNPKQETEVENLRGKGQTSDS